MAAAGEGVDYVTQIKPILAARCYACHSALGSRRGCGLIRRRCCCTGGDSGAAIEPGKTAESLVVQMVTGELGVRMPPEGEGEALSDAQIALIKKWIDEGAYAPGRDAAARPAQSLGVSVAGAA